MSENLYSENLYSENLYSVHNKLNFPSLLYTLNLNLLRKEVFEFLIRRKNEEEYFDLNEFHTKYIRDDSLLKLCEEITSELTKLGWKTQLAFGNTGLYIYSTETLPSTCW